MPELRLPSPRRLGLPTALLGLAGLLAGCSGSGYYAYLGDTFTPPFGANPNGAKGSSETWSKIRAKAIQPPTPILYEPGDVWPPPPKPPATLKDLQLQQNQELSSGGSGSGYTPMELPKLPGYDVPDQQVHPVAPRPTFPAGIVPLPQGQHGVITGGGSDLKSMNGPTGTGSIVVPNGNGTSTVIGPSGTVSTIPTPGR